SNDSINGPFADRHEILISGAGDGGLIDLVRATMRTADEDSFFYHDKLIQRLTSNPSFEMLAREMRRIDERARLAEIAEVPFDLTREYEEKLDVPSALVSEITGLARDDTRVTFHYRKEKPFNLKSLLVNRLLAFLLIKSGLVTFEFGEIKEEPSPTDVNKKLVTFTRPDGRTTQTEFHQVLRRYGPPKDYFKSSFEQV